VTDQNRDDVVVLDHLVELVGCGVGPPILVNRPEVLHDHHRAAGVADIAFQVVGKEFPRVLRVVAPAVGVGLAFPDIAREQVDVDEVHAVPVP